MHGNLTVWASCECMVWDPSLETPYLLAGNLRGSSSTQARAAKKWREIMEEDLLRESECERRRKRILDH